MVVGLFICLIPTIFPEVDPKAEKRKNDAQGVSRVMWPIIFMLGFVSGTQRQKKSNCNSTISIGLIRIPGLVWDECFVSRESEAHAGEN